MKLKQTALLELPLNCSYHPPFSDQCLTYVWANITGCETASTIAATLNITVRNDLINSTNYRRLQSAIMRLIQNDPLLCYGFGKFLFYVSGRCSRVVVTASTLQSVILGSTPLSIHSKKRYFLLRSTFIGSDIKYETANFNLI